METSNLFYGATTAVEVEKRYQKLRKVFEGEDEMIKNLTDQYTELIKKLSEPNPTDAVIDKATVEEKIVEVQEKIHTKDVHLERIGQWLWLSGKTFPIKDTLKALNFNYAGDKKCYFWRPENARSANAKPLPLELIREKYGAHVVALG